MFNRLRLGLSLLYLGAALALIALVGAGTYRLIDAYFQSTTDLALQHRMAHEFLRLGAPVSPELEAADRNWYATRAALIPPTPARAAPARPTPQGGSHEEEAEGEGPDGGGAAGQPPLDSANEGSAEDLYDGDLAAIFVLPLDTGGQLIAAPPASLPLAPDGQAATAALTGGSDWRTVNLGEGTRVRLLTYRLPPGSSPAILQLGRTLGDQDRVLQQLLLALLGLGAGSAVVLGGGSWWLAGRALRPAQAAWVRQQAFVANASHELRTPLTLLRASAEVARRGLSAEDRDGRDLLEDVLQEADHMNRLVEDLLLLSRLDAGRLVPAREPIALPALLADVQRQVGRLAVERNVAVTVTAATGTALADPTRLRQVLLILLDNALRHTPGGGQIGLTARPEGRTVQIRVTDTGSGIAPEHLAHVFERFYRATGAPGTQAGTGLGLAIAKGLIAAQHGHIAIQSQVGTGTQVTLTLPVAPAAPAPAPRAG